MSCGADESYEQTKELNKQLEALDTKHRFKGLKLGLNNRLEAQDNKHCNCFRMLKTKHCGDIREPPFPHLCHRSKSWINKHFKKCSCDYKNLHENCISTKGFAKNK